jgi:hypothetical protein
MFFWNRQPLKPLWQWFCRGAPVSSSIISNQLQRGLWLGDVSMDGSCIRACKTVRRLDFRMRQFLILRLFFKDVWLSITGAWRWILRSVTHNISQHPRRSSFILPIAGWIIQQLLRQSLHFAAWARWGVRKHSISHQFSSHL